MRCLRSPLYSMEAEILHWEGVTEGDPEETVGQGTWESYQDPITFEILNRWVPANLDDPDTTLVDESGGFVKTIPCMARGIVNAGIRAAATTESFGDTYQNVDFIKLKIPPYVTVTKRDRITNIRETADGRILWRNEESDGAATVFNVNGVVPIMDSFNHLIEWVALLERADGSGSA